MLKKYEDREPLSVHQVSVITEVDQGPSEVDEQPSTEGGSHEIPSPGLVRTQTPADVTLSSNLSNKQRSEVLALFKEFDIIFSDLPGRTELVECALRLTSDKPIHVPQ